MLIRIFSCSFSILDNVTISSNIKYIKGDLPCFINCTNEAQATPINYVNTKFENIDVKIGNFVIEKSGKRTLVVEASGKTVINLPEYYGII